jgi:hypothetical protein
MNIVSAVVRVCSLGKASEMGRLLEVARSGRTAFVMRFGLNPPEPYCGLTYPNPLECALKTGR